MQKIIFFLVLVVFVFGMGCSGEKDTSKVPDSKESKDVMASLPEGPLSLPAESNPEANTHNDEGILHYKEDSLASNQGYYQLPIANVS